MVSQMDEQTEWQVFSQMDEQTEWRMVSQMEEHTDRQALSQMDEQTYWKVVTGQPFGRADNLAGCLPDRRADSLQAGQGVRRVDEQTD
jgi:Mg/Co/Ni transporter MgtE